MILPECNLLCKKARDICLF